MRHLYAATCLAIWLCPAPAFSTTVYRCEDTSGRITFTRQGCPENNEQRLQKAYNPTPGSGKPVPLAKAPKAGRKSKSKNAQDIVVIGIKQDGCGNLLSSSERRTAIIKQQVRAGMSVADVESSLGRPDKVSENNGQTRYVYEGRKGNKRNVVFDQAGCVKSKAKR